MSNNLHAISNIIQGTHDKFVSVAPSNIVFDKESSFALQILRNNDYLMSLANKDPSSLKSAIFNIATIGLSLNPAEKQAYLIPRKGKIYLEPSYMGLCKLATDSGSIEWVQARCVYANDNFMDNGINERPTHQYNAFSDRGEFVGVYCVAKTNTGDYLTTIMDKARIFDIRGRSETWKSKPNTGAWQTDFEEQAKKTVVRNAAKMWPKTNMHLNAAVELSNRNEGFEKIEITEPSICESSDDQKKYFDSMIESGNALDMYVFKRSLVATEQGISQWTNLVHSFPKGQKGKYGDIVMGLTQKGESIFLDCVSGVIESIESQDAGQLIEIIEDISSDAEFAIIEKLNPEQEFIFNELKEGRS